MTCPVRINWWNSQTPRDVNTTILFQQMTLAHAPLANWATWQSTTEPVPEADPFILPIFAPQIKCYTAISLEFMHLLTYPYNIKAFHYYTLSSLQKKENGGNKISPAINSYKKQITPSRFMSWSESYKYLNVLKCVKVHKKVM